MSRLTQVSDAAAAGQASELFAAIKGKVGMVPNLYRVLANQPAVLGGLLGFNEALSKGGFDAKTREAISLTVAGANACDYCSSAHAAISKSLNVADDEITRRLRGESSDPKTAAILNFAKTVVDKRGLVSDLELKAARDAGLSEGDVIETIANVVVNILTNYVNHVAQTEIDFPVTRAQAA